MKVLIVEVNGQLYGFELRKTRRIVSNVKYTPIPFVPKIFKGLAVLRGEVVTIVCLNGILGLEEFKGEEDLFLLIKGRESSWGFPINNIFDIVEVEDEKIEKLEDPFTFGDFKIGEDRVVLLIDTDQVEDYLYESVSSFQK